MINDNTLNFIRFSSGFNNLKKEELEAFAENEIFELNEYNASEEIQRKHFYTLLKNNDGTQGVAQEDGKYIHTAWAYNSDGTDGFTTVYPNLNLLNFKSGLKIGVFLAWVDGLTLEKNPARAVFDYVSVIPGATYTINANWDKTERIAIYAYDSNAEKKAAFIYDGSSAKWASPSLIGRVITQKTTFSIPDGMNFIRVVFFAKDASAKLTLQDILDAKIKLEPGSTATPWMPSASEVTTADWPSYMGQYTDYTLEDSINPSSYTWIKIQGKYFYTLEDVNTNGTLKSYIIECLKLSLQTRWGNNLEYHIDRKTKYLNKLTGMQA